MQRKIFKIFKRIMDFFFSFVLIMFFAIPILLISFLILLFDGKPVFFVQERLGFKGKVFKLIKFRTMANGAEASGVFSDKNDTRVTKFGAFLRMTSLDELPQLFNIFKGEMSFIGPRPVLTYHPFKFSEYSSYQRKMFDVKPGLTGWAQVHGRKTVEWEKRIDLNVWYVRHISLLLDLKIFFLTIYVVLFAHDNNNNGSSKKRSHLRLMYITNKKNEIITASKNGVDYIFIDMEFIGKEKRQHNIDSVKNHHTISDVKKASKYRRGDSEILVRINPFYHGTKKEIDDSINAGADVIMLPMFKTKAEVENFVALVGGRAKTCLLLETKESLLELDDILDIAGIDQLHIGLNDLHLSMKLKFMFELVSNGTVKMICEKCISKKIPVGFGGISRIGDGDVDAALIIPEHFKIGSSFAILSRGFVDRQLPKKEYAIAFADNIKALRKYEEEIVMQSDSFFENNEKKLFEQIMKVSKCK